MKIIAKTNGGCLIEAGTSEVVAILTAVNGTVPKEIEMGQKIPAIDYAGTITKIKALEGSYEFKQLSARIKGFNEEADKLTAAVENASNIE